PLLERPPPRPLIALHAAILFPVFAKAREKARQATCTSNLKQIGDALMMYVQDSDEQLPFGGRSPVAGETTPTRWHTLLQPYIKNGLSAGGRGSTGVFTCPSRPTFPSNPSEKLGYGGNNNLFGWGHPNPATNIPSKTLAEITTPTGTFAFCDAGWLNTATATPGSANNLNPDTWVQNENSATDYNVFPPGQ